MEQILSIVSIIFFGTIAIGVLVFIHEGGHYLAARAFGVRVSEFMLGLPGPNLSFKRGETRFGVTCVPLGGYARICGMEPGPINPHLKPVLAALYERGTANMEDIAGDCGITDDEAYEALMALVEWGCAQEPAKKDKYNTFRACEVCPTDKQIAAAKAAGEPAPRAYALGEPRHVDDANALFEREYAQQYRSLPFWKRAVILLAGITCNILFALLIFIVIYSIIGFDITDADGIVRHATLTPDKAILAGFSYIGMIVEAVLKLFNPITAGQVISDSTSIIGIAVISKSAAEAGLTTFLAFCAMLSVSLGIMNLLPIPPLDGGRFVVEVYQAIVGREVSPRAMRILSSVGVALFLGLFVIMMNQDIQRFIFGNW